MESIRIESVVKDFGTIRALDGIDLNVEPGELFFLLGASGCGKTTLLRCIAGLETPTSGSVHFGEREVTRMPPHKREAAMVFQSYALWPHLTVAQNIAFGLEERKVSKPEIRRRVEEVLEMVQLPGFGPRSIDQMSGGQQQRVSLARALVVRPRCLLLDEPLSNLDAQLRIEMRLEIRRIVKENGLTAVYVTHDQEEALAMADRMAVLTRGRIGQVGTPEDVYRNPLSAYVARFIGETNIIHGELAGLEGEIADVRTAAGILRGRVTDPRWKPASGDTVRLSIRPEAWRLHKKEGDNPLPGTVAVRSYLGQRIQYWIDTAAGKQQVVEMNPHVIHEPGDDSIILHCRADDAVVLKP
ncbi:MAG: ABC transporter ATP-binding protein [Verrucomicrobia bacterium]|nr:ABC transporter ATP-binding protein [Verrucomicrobiota bacterium]